MPDAYEDWTLDNYYARSEEPHGADAVLNALYDRTGAAVPVAALLAGDIILVRGLNNNIVPAIYCGNRKAMTSIIDRGVRVFSLKGMSVITARRVP